MKLESLQRFSKESGFKILAMARLSQIEYSIVLYLINCAASGLEEIITTDAELSSLVGYDENKIRKAIEDLDSRYIIKIRYGQPHANPDVDSLRIGMQFDLSQWTVNQDEDLNHSDAIVFPFRRGDTAALQVVTMDKEETPPTKALPTWRRVFDSFIKNRSFDDDEMDSMQEEAKVLVETHPVDQILLMIRHFGGRIPTLSLLASSWQHYHEVFEEETQKVDMLGARQKHQELELQLRNYARNLLSESEENELSQEEQTVLDILIKHRHPRRQLFWAYQSRSRYPNLSEFFDENAELMLAVTSSGKVVPARPKAEE